MIVKVWEGHIILDILRYARKVGIYRRMQNGNDFLIYSKVICVHQDPNGTDECGFSAIYAKSQIDESGFESGFLSSTNTSSINNNVRIYTFLSYGDGIGSSTQPSYYHSQYARCIKD